MGFREPKSLAGPMTQRGRRVLNQNPVCCSLKPEWVAGEPREGHEHSSHIHLPHGLSYLQDGDKNVRGATQVSKVKPAPHRH